LANTIQFSDTNQNTHTAIFFCLCRGLFYCERESCYSLISSSPYMIPSPSIHPSISISNPHHFASLLAINPFSTTNLLSNASNHLRLSASNLAISPSPTFPSPPTILA